MLASWCCLATAQPAVSQLTPAGLDARPDAEVPDWSASPLPVTGEEFNTPRLADDPANGDSQWLGAWRKGDYRIVPYGIGSLNIAFESSRSIPGPFTLYVQSDDLQGEPSFIVNARATRLGFDVYGPQIAGAETAGRIEFDFHRPEATENLSGVLLRHAYGEFKTESYRLLAGQTWDVVSPLIPNTVNYAVGWAAGNIGHRRAQVRGERYQLLPGGQQLTVEASLNRSIVVDFAGAQDIQGEDAGWPTLMGRIAVGEPPTSGSDRIAGLGISGHIGQEGVDFRVPPLQDDARFLSWSANIDLRIGRQQAWGVQGEFFIGQVLGTFLGGINHGIDAVTRRPIHSIGGWGEIWFYPAPRWHCHLGYGIDDPRNSDLGFSPSGRANYNQFLFSNVMFDITPQFNVAFEISLWDTHFVGLADGQSLRAECAVKYSF